MEAHKVARRLNSTTRALKEWNKKHFGMTQHKIKNLESKLQQIQLGNQLDDVEQSNILEELRVQRERLESIFKQKSREVWLKEGDRNTKFFHTSTLVRRRRNKIVKIKAGKDWIQGKEEIKNYFIREFKELFYSNIYVIHEDLEGLAEHRILEEDKCSLLRT